jgi:hypothetical protein
MLDAITQRCQNYYNQIPADTIPKVAKSALYSFSIGVIYVTTGSVETLDIARPLFHAGVAALASLIYALANPLFNLTFGDREVYLHREILKLSVVSSLTAVSVCCLTASKINLTAIPLLSLIPVNAMKAYLDLYPIIFGWFNPAFTSRMRNIYQGWGIQVEKDSSSVFLMW